MDSERWSETVPMILPLIILQIAGALGLDDDLGTNLTIIVFIVGVLAVAVIVGRKFSKKKKR